MWELSDFKPTTENPKIEPLIIPKKALRSKPKVDKICNMTNHMTPLSKFSTTEKRDFRSPCSPLPPLPDSVKQSNRTPSIRLKPSNFSTGTSLQTNTRIELEGE